jgi:hypothetical protein
MFIFLLVVLRFTDSRYQDTSKNVLVSFTVSIVDWALVMLSQSLAIRPLGVVTARI